MLLDRSQVCVELAISQKARFRCFFVDYLSLDRRVPFGTSFEFRKLVAALDGRCILLGAILLIELEVLIAFIVPMHI